VGRQPALQRHRALLRDPVAYRALLAELAQDLSLPNGTSLRDDFAFLLLALRRLEGRAGAVAFGTERQLAGLLP
jgi:hypothetical protein